MQKRTLTLPSVKMPQEKENNVTVVAKDVHVAGFAHNEFRTDPFAQNEVYCVARFFLLMD